MKYSIECGYTDSAVYIGIQPPLTEDLRAKILRQLPEEVIESAIALDSCLEQNPFANSDFSELAVIESTANRNGHVAGIARSIGEMLIIEGHEVTSSNELKLLLTQELFPPSGKY